MEFKRRFLIFGVACAILVPTLSALAGCGSNDMVKEDPGKTQARVDAAGKMRSYFDKSNGNYDSLSADDKAALNKLTGSEAHSKEAFGHMSMPGGGLPPSGPRH